jgi:hypothetical protein
MVNFRTKNEIDYRFVKGVNISRGKIYSQQMAPPLCATSAEKANPAQFRLRRGK